MYMKRVKKKKLTGRHNKVAKWLFNYFFFLKKKHPPEVFYEKAVLKNFTMYTGRKKLVVSVL